MSRAGWLFIAAVVLAAFSSMVAWQREPSATSTIVSLDGAALFQAKGCSTCHDGPGSSALIGAGSPSLAEASALAGDRRPNLTAGEYLAESIRDPGVFVSPASSPNYGPMNAMPSLELSTAEVDSIVEYLLARRGRTNGRTI